MTTPQHAGRSLPDTDRLPHALYRAAQVQALDRHAIEGHGIPGEVLMERAGAAAYRLLRERWPDVRDISVVVGTGNNGGDGLVVARLARDDGLRTRVLQLGDPARIRGDAALNRERYIAAGGGVEPFTALPRGSGVIVDGVFGTGLEREVGGDWAVAIEAINAHHAPTLALDIPSGLHADTGAVLGVAVEAAATISFIGLKQGLFTGMGPACAGQVRFDGLAVPATIYRQERLSARRIDWAALGSRLSPRPACAHKGQFGHVLVIGGAPGFGGAARLAAEAAARCGAGLTSLATAAGHVTAVLSARPEVMARPVTGAGDLAPLLAAANVVAVGPGLGRDAWGEALWRAALGRVGPLVLDADALNMLAADPQRRDDWVLTPHPGEAARLLGIPVAAVSADRFAAAAALVERYGGVVVLKGAGTVIAAANDRPPAVCSDGNPGMASGGMGDVLTGVIAARLAQGQDAVTAAEFGVALHAAAADRAAADGGERGLLAGDLMPWLRRLSNPA